MRLSLICIILTFVLFAQACVSDEGEKTTKPSPKTKQEVVKTSENPVKPKVESGAKKNNFSTKGKKSENQIALQQAQRLGKAYCACTGTEVSECRKKQRQEHTDMLNKMEEGARKKLFKSAFENRIVACH